VETTKTELSLGRVFSGVSFYVTLSIYAVRSV